MFKKGLSHKEGKNNIYRRKVNKIIHKIVVIYLLNSFLISNACKKIARQNNDGITKPIILMLIDIAQNKEKINILLIENFFNNLSP